jgi:pimeloyl-ACP methyl ester carboxylesterase
MQRVRTASKARALPGALVGFLVFSPSSTTAGQTGSPAGPAVAPEPTAESVKITAADGAVLQGRRLRGGSVPIVLLHGLAASFHQFDLDAEGAPALAQFLARRGCDVWLINLRGAGRGGDASTIAPGRKSWCADELILEDLPAIAAHVRAAGVERPFLLGHSLGGMVITAYLAGAVKIAPANIDAGVRIDPEVARARNEQVRGALFISAPARIAWPDGRKPPALERLAKLGRAPLHILLPPRLPVSALNLDGNTDAGFRGLAEKAVEGLESLLGGNHWTVLAFGERNTETTRRLIRKVRGGVLGDTSEDLLLQLALGAREGTWPSWRGPVESRIDYSQHYGNITVPVFAGVGEQDLVASAEVIRISLVEKVGSADRRLVVFRGYGHSDITLADGAHRDVFGTLLEWISERAAPRQPR